MSCELHAVCDLRDMLVTNGPVETRTSLRTPWQQKSFLSVENFEISRRIPMFPLHNRTFFS